VDGMQADAELLRLTAHATAIDDRLAELQPRTNKSRLGSADRRRYAELRDRREVAWRRVFGRSAKSC